MIPCLRCGKPFEPVLMKALKKMSRNCEPCGFRNLMDGLGLPTPPEMLDRHTKRPTLTDAEYRKEMLK